MALRHKPRMINYVLPRAQRALAELHTFALLTFLLILRKKSLHTHMWAFANALANDRDSSSFARVFAHCLIILQFMPGGARPSFQSAPASFGTNDDECRSASKRLEIFPKQPFLRLLIVYWYQVPVHYRARHNVWRTRSRILISCSHPICTNDCGQ